jgi:predicted nuclease with RNAse H fold
MAVQALVVASVPAAVTTFAGAPLALAQSGTLRERPPARRRVGASVLRPSTAGAFTTVCRADADMLSLWNVPVMNSPALRRDA